MGRSVWPSLQRLARGMLVLGVLTVVAVSSASSPPAQAGPGSLHIHNLHGSVVRLGSYAGLPLWGVRVRATVCFPSPAAALAAYPTAIEITHYAVTHARSRWWAARTAIDHAPWLVPFGETWHGKACGAFSASDPIPPQHYGAESLGNDLACYGVRLTIQVGRQRATKRAIVRCPFGG